MDILKIRLNEDGMCDFAPDFKVMRGGYKDITLQIEVPHSMLLYPALDVDSSYNHTGNNVRIGAIVHTSTGHNIKTKRYEFKRVKDFKVNNIDYRLYQRPMPKEFTMWETVSELEEATPGLLEMIINVVNWTKDETGAKIEEILPSHFVSVEVHPSTYLDEGEEIESPSDFEILHSQVQEMDAKVEEIDAELDVTTANTNSLLKLAKLKINVSDIKDGVYYSEDGYKSPFYEFYPVVYSLPNADGVKVSKECSVVATQMVADSASPEVVGYQTEYAYADDGVYIRTNKYNISQASIGNYTLLTNGEWKLANQQRVEQVAEIASGNTKNIEELVANIKAEFTNVKNAADETKNALEAEIANVNKKVDTGTNYVGQYPTRDTMPSNDELNTFVSDKMSRTSQRGDEVNFVLQVENGVDKVYTFKYSEADSTWDIIEIPGAELAGNNDAGYIIGTNRAENEEKLISGIVKMLLDIQSGEVKDIKVYNKNIEKIVSLITSVVLYDGENRVLASELYGKDSDGSFSYVKLNNNVIEIGDHTKVSLYKGKNKKVYYSWIEDGAVKSDSFAYDGDIGDYSLLEGRNLIDYCVDLYNAHTELKANLEKEIARANAAEDLKLDKTNINEDYLKDITFSLNGDTGVAIATYKNPVSGVSTNIQLQVINPATSSMTGLMTAEMVKSLNTALSDIESLKYVGRQIQIFDTYADALNYDWSNIGSLNINDYFVVIADESREIAEEKGKTTKYTCVDNESPITVEDSFTFSGLITTVVIQVATETEIGGVVSSTAKGYIYVEPTGAMKLVGYDEIIESITNLTSSIESETARAIAAESKLEETKANKTDLPTKVSELDNDANYAKTEQLPTALSQLQDDIGVGDKAEKTYVDEQVSEAKTYTNNLETILPTYRGAYSSTVQYHKGDIVQGNFGLYIALQDSLGKSITEQFVFENEYWKQLALNAGSIFASGNVASNKIYILGASSTGNGAKQPYISSSSVYMQGTKLYSENSEVSTKNYVDTAIAGLGTVFDLKGTKATVSDLPTESNEIGDVWYVVAEEVGYVWLNDGTTDRWEKFGAPIDLSGYVTNETFSEFQTQVQEMSVGMTTMVSGVRTELVDMKMDKSNPTGTGTFSLNRKADTTIGEYSVVAGFECEASGEYSYAEGVYTTASGGASHAEGSGTTASGQFAHAEGEATIASLNNTHAEGGYTQAIGSYAHAEGVNTIARGPYSHSQGHWTIASGECSHAMGKYNIEDTEDKYAEIVGNGTSESSRSNARTLDWSGNQWLAGSSTAQLFNAVSDRRLKENIKDYKCKKSILDLPIKEFDYKKTGTHAIGCIAQDLQEICPEIVNTDNNGYLSIQESKLVYLLLQEVKQLKAEIDKIKEV